jgi:hypothetical protein
MIYHNGSVRLRSDEEHVPDRRSVHRLNYGRAVLVKAILPNKSVVTVLTVAVTAQFL